MGARALVRITRRGYNFPRCGGIGTPLPLHLTGEQVKGINPGHCRGGRCNGRPVFVKGRWPPCPNPTSDHRAAFQGDDGELWQQTNYFVRRMIPGHYQFPRPSEPFIDESAARPSAFGKTYLRLSIFPIRKMLEHLPFHNGALPETV